MIDLNRPAIDLDSLSKDTLVAMYRIIHGSTGDYARLSREHYLSELKKRGTFEVQDAFDRAPKRERKQSLAQLERRNALAEAKEFRAIARALASWGSDLLSNPDAHATLLARANKALGGTQ